MAAGSLSKVARATTRPCSSTTQMAVSLTETSSPTKCCMVASLSQLGVGRHSAADWAAETAPRIPHLGPARRRACVEHIVHTTGVPERRACTVLGQHRSTQREVPRGQDDEERLTVDIIELARQYGRYGYRKITALLR